MCAWLFRTNREWGRGRGWERMTDLWGGNFIKLAWVCGDLHGSRLNKKKKTSLSAGKFLRRIDFYGLVYSFCKLQWLAYRCLCHRFFEAMMRRHQYFIIGIWEQLSTDLCVFGRIISYLLSAGGNDYVGWCEEVAEEKEGNGSCKNDRCGSGKNGRCVDKGIIIK